MEAGAAIRKLVGGLMLAAGMLIALTCGLCTTYFAITVAVDHFRTHAPDSLGIIGALLAYGGGITAVGSGMAWLGLVLLRMKPNGDRDTRKADR